MREPEPSRVTDILFGRETARTAEAPDKEIAQVAEPVEGWADSPLADTLVDPLVTKEAEERVQPLRMRGRKYPRAPFLQAEIHAGLIVAAAGRRRRGGDVYAGPGGDGFPIPEDLHGSARSQIFRHGPGNRHHDRRGIGLMRHKRDAAEHFTQCPPPGGTAVRRHFFTPL
jgi:hypothetical protein